MSASTIETPPHIPVTGSRDLSGSTRKQLEIIVHEENGHISRYTLPPLADGMSFGDGLRSALQTKSEKTLPEWDFKNCPCVVVSFDPGENELTVRMLPTPPEPPAQPPA